jgi:hypothetical protein
MPPHGHLCGQGWGLSLHRVLKRVIPFGVKKCTALWGVEIDVTLRVSEPLAQWQSSSGDFLKNLLWEGMQVHGKASLVGSSGLYISLLEGVLRKLDKNM